MYKDVYNGTCRKNTDVLMLAEWQQQANGAAFMHYGDTTVLSTATASEKPREGIDFFPLSVEYEEKIVCRRKDPGRI